MTDRTPYINPDRIYRNVAVATKVEALRDAGIIYPDPNDIDNPIPSPMLPEDYRADHDALADLLRDDA